MALTVNPGTITAKLRLDPNFSPVASAQKEVATSIQGRLRQSDIQAILKTSCTPPKNPKFKVTVLRDGTILKSQDGAKTQRLGIMDATELFMKLYPKPVPNHPLRDRDSEEIPDPSLDTVQENPSFATIHTSPTQLQDSDNSIVINTSPNVAQFAEDNPLSGSYEIHTSPAQREPEFATIHTNPGSNPHDSKTINTQPFVQSRSGRQQSDHGSTFSDTDDDRDQQESAIIYTSPSRPVGAQAIHQPRSRRRKDLTRQATGFLTVNTKPGFNLDDSTTVTTHPSTRSLKREKQQPYAKSSFDGTDDEYDPTESQSSTIHTHPVTMPPLYRQRTTLNTARRGKSERQRGEQSSAHSDLQDDSAHKPAAVTIRHSTLKRLNRRPHYRANSGINTRRQTKQIHPLSITHPASSSHPSKALLSNASQSCMKWEEHQTTLDVHAPQPLQVDAKPTSDEDTLISHYSGVLQHASSLTENSENKRLLTLLQTSFDAYNEELISRATLAHLLRTIHHTDLNEQSSNELMSLITTAIYQSVDAMYRQLHQELKHEKLYPGELVVQGLLDLLFDTPQLQNLSLEVRASHLLSIRESTKPTVSDEEALLQLTQIKELLTQIYLRPTQNSTLAEAAKHWELRSNTNASNTQPFIYSSPFPQPTQNDLLELVRSYFNKYTTTQIQFSTKPDIPHADIRLLDLLTPIFNAEYMGLLSQDQLIKLIQTIDAHSEALNDETTFTELQSTITTQLQAATSLNRRGSHQSVIATLLPQATMTSSADSQPNKPLLHASSQQLYSPYERRFNRTIKPQPKRINEETFISYTEPRELVDINVENKQPKTSTTTHAPTVYYRELSIIQSEDFDDSSITPTTSHPTTSVPIETPAPEPISKKAFKSQLMDLISPVGLPFYNELLDFIENELETTPAEKFDELKNTVIAKIRVHYFNLYQTTAQKVTPPIASQKPLTQTTPLATSDTDMQTDLSTRSTSTQYDSLIIPAEAPTTSDASAQSNEDPRILSINHTGTQTSRTAPSYVPPPSYAASASKFKHPINSNTEAIPSETLTINEPAPLEPASDLQIFQEYYQDLKNEYTTQGQEHIHLLPLQFIDTWMPIDEKTALMKIVAKIREENENDEEALAKLHETFPEHFPYSTYSALSKPPINDSQKAEEVLKKYEEQQRAITENHQKRQKEINQATDNLQTLQNKYTQLKQESLSSLEFQLLSFLNPIIDTSPEQRRELAPEITKRRAQGDSDASILAHLDSDYPQFFPQEESNPTIEDKARDLPADSPTKDVTSGSQTHPSKPTKVLDLSEYTLERPSRRTSQYTLERPPRRTSELDSLRIGSHLPSNIEIKNDAEVWQEIQKKLGPAIPPLLQQAKSNKVKFDSHIRGQSSISAPSSEGPVGIAEISINTLLTECAGKSPDELFSLTQTHYQALVQKQNKDSLSKDEELWLKLLQIHKWWQEDFTTKTVIADLIKCLQEDLKKDYTSREKILQHFERTWPRYFPKTITFSNSDSEEESSI